MEKVVLPLTWVAITALLLMVAYAGGATVYAFTFAGVISTLTAVAGFGVSRIIRFLEVN